MHLQNGISFILCPIGRSTALYVYDRGTKTAVFVAVQLFFPLPQFFLPKSLIPRRPSFENSMTRSLTILPVTSVVFRCRPTYSWRITQGLTASLRAFSLLYLLKWIFHLYFKIETIVYFVFRELRSKQVSIPITMRDGMKNWEY